MASPSTIMDAYDRQDSSGRTPRYNSTSALGQLRQNLRDARLRETMHRPYHPSPLSRSPVQASISSASRTAASIASSSRSTVSTSTTPPSTSSRFSINQAFKALNDDDISFFDRLIATLPPHAADFSQLKSAYTAHLPDELDYRERQAGSSRHADQTDWDAHLWSILLSLVKVRGRSWRERWDSVRLAFGLDPNSGDETDQSAGTQNTSVSATGSSTQHAYDSVSEQEHEQHLHGSRNASLQKPSHRADRNLRFDLGLPRSSSPPSVHTTAIHTAAYHRTLRDELNLADETQTGQTHLDDPISAIPARLSRMLDADDHREQESTGPSSNDRGVGSSKNAARLPIDARRRFDDLIRSSQLARSRLRQSQAVQNIAEETDDLVEDADLWRARRLLQTCLAWWITLTRNHLERSANAVDASNRVLVQKAWERWRAESLRGMEGARIGAKTDRVRCTLTAFRQWKRRAHTAVERKEELKKGSMRTAYYMTTARVKKRMLEQAFTIWRNRHQVNKADSIRQHHLQSGAFSLWQMRSSQCKQLSTREKIIKIKQNHSFLARAWDRWADKADQAQIVGQFQHRHHQQLASNALHVWREKTTLSGLSKDFAQRRLKMAALDSWKVALEQRRLHRKQEALANCWRARRLKRTTLLSWHQSRQKLSAMQQQADTMRHELQQDHMQSALHRWQLKSRAALLARVRTSSNVERAFRHWKQRHTALTTSLNQRESTIVSRRQETVKAAVFQRWSRLTKQLRDREAHVQAQKNETLCNDVFVTWRNNLLEQRLLQQKSVAVSDFFTLRSALRQWRSQLREHRADVKEANHERRLAHQVFVIWRTKAAKQQRLADTLQQTLLKKDEALTRAYLSQWVARIIEVRNRELEVKEQRQRRLLKAAFYAWIEACLRHDDLLALMNSYVDVKEEDRKRQTFLRWLNFARDQRDRREKAELLARNCRAKLLAATWTTWRDRVKERSLAVYEYEMLLRRQQLTKQWALRSWQSQTLLLPAIRMCNMSLKRTALQRWRERLPDAQMSNQARKFFRAKTLQRSWQAWMTNAKAQRQLRAAARFGAGSISMARLRTLSAASRTGSSSPAAAQSSSSPRGLTPRRARTSLALRKLTSADDRTSMEDVPTRRSSQHEPSTSRRSASVPRPLASLSTDSMLSHDPVESPSKYASSRKANRAGPTLFSAAHLAPSDTESDVARRIRRSAKHDATSAATPRLRMVGLRPPASNDGDSVQSAPVGVDAQRGPRQSLAVAEDMIEKLRARARSQSRA